jgi:PadR family transcriptional regulator, regulatory protein PadR
MSGIAPPDHFAYDVANTEGSRMPVPVPPPGEFEHLVLLAVLQCGDAAYAVPVRHHIEARAGRAVARGALYTTLDRLEAKGYLRSRMGEPTPARGGRAKRYYAVTALGMRALRASRTALGAALQGLDALLGDAP